MHFGVAGISESYQGREAALTTGLWANLGPAQCELKFKFKFGRHQVLQL